MTDISREGSNDTSCLSHGHFEIAVGLRSGIKAERVH